MEKIAALLRQARENQGLSLEEAGQKSRIPHSYLEALEGRGQTHLLADRVYLIPFLRAYATFLGLNPSSAVSRFLAEEQAPPGNSPTPASPWPSPPPRSSGWVLPLSVVLILLLIALVLWNERTGRMSLEGHNEEREGMAKTDAPEFLPSPSATEAPPLSAIPSTPTETVSPDIPTSTSPTPEVASVPAPAPSTSATATEPAPPSTTTSGASPSVPSSTTISAVDTPGVTSSPSSPPSQSGHLLKMQAKSTTWVRIAVDDQPYKDSVLRPGEQREWAATTGYTITLGNAGGVDLILDGQSLPPVGRPGQVVRNLRLPADASGAPTTSAAPTPSAALPQPTDTSGATPAVVN